MLGEQNEWGLVRDWMRMRQREEVRENPDFRLEHTGVGAPFTL